MTLATTLSGLGVADLLRGYGERTFSPADVLQAVTTKVCDLEPRVGALVAERLEAAEQDARRATDRYMHTASAGPRPLEGVPFVVKDLVSTAQLPTRWGLAPRTGARSISADAAVVSLLLGAGAILVGKSATHQLGLGLTTASPEIERPTRNPWKISHCAGGSSGGSAAALASGEVPLAIGTDTAGSIRVPADFCGVYGLRPSRGRIPSAGVLPVAASLDQVGPMARTAGDLAVAFAALCGSAESSANSGEITIAGLRVGVSHDLDGGLAAPDRRELVLRAAAFLEGLGASVHELSLPASRRSHETLAATISSELRHPPADAQLHADVAGRFRRAAMTEASEVAAALGSRRRIGFELRRALENVDVLLSPSSGRGPLPLTDGGGTEDFRAAVMASTGPQSLAGLPAVAVPIGLNDDGLPAGVQLSASPGRESLLLRIADVLGWLGRPTPIPTLV